MGKDRASCAVLNIDIWQIGIERCHLLPTREPVGVVKHCSCHRIDLRGLHELVRDANGQGLSVDDDFDDVINNLGGDKPKFLDNVSARFRE